jgi:hypothetical protein
VALLTTGELDLQGSWGQFVIVLTIPPIALPLIAPLSGPFIAALTSCRLLLCCTNVKRSQRFNHQQAHHTHHPSARDPKRQLGNVIPPCEQNIPMSQRLLRGDRHNLQFLSTMHTFAPSELHLQCYTPYSDDSMAFLQLQRAPFHHGPPHRCTVWWTCVAKAHLWKKIPGSPRTPRRNRQRLSSPRVLVPLRNI